MSGILGVVPLIGRGLLVHESIGGVTLVDRAIGLASAVCTEVVVVTGHGDTGPQVGAPGVTQIELPMDDSILRARLDGVDQVVIHDPLCPLVSDAFVRSVVAGAGTRTIAAVRPVTDTIKALTAGAVTGTVDRDLLRVVTSPIVIPAHRMRDLADLEAALADLSVLVEAIRARSVVELVDAPSAASRVEDSSALRLLMVMDDLSSEPGKPI